MYQRGGRDFQVHGSQAETLAAEVVELLGGRFVEGPDRTVRGSRVFLKTLGGLLPVDVILRRIPDGDCDQLELESQSPFGTAGLVQSLRDGKVSMANGIGSADLVEAMSQAGMLGFFGAAGLSLAEVESAIDRLQRSLADRPLGFNLIHSPGEPDLEQAVADLYLGSRRAAVVASRGGVGGPIVVAALGAFGLAHFGKKVSS